MKSFTSSPRRWQLAGAIALVLTAASLPTGAFASEDGFTADLKSGKKVYSATCFVCHGKDGKGPLPGVPDMTGKKTRLLQNDAILLKHVTEGYQSKGSPMAMPAKGGNPNLTEADLKNVIAFMKASFLPKK